MADISETIIAKSDQMNAVDLIAGPITIKVVSVKVIIGNDQPVHINWEGGEGRPFKPCKNMRRVLAVSWGNDSDNWIGRSMVLFNDPDVLWGGKRHGGIRISHLTNINNDMTIVLTETRNKKISWVVKVLNLLKPKLNTLSQEDFQVWCNKISLATTMAELSSIGADIKAQQYDEAGSSAIRKYYQVAVDRIRNAEQAPIEEEQAASKYTVDQLKVQVLSWGIPFDLVMGYFIANGIMNEGDGISKLPEEWKLPIMEAPDSVKKMVKDFIDSSDAQESTEA